MADGFNLRVQLAIFLLAVLVILGAGPEVVSRVRDLAVGTFTVLRGGSITFETEAAPFAVGAGFLIGGDGKTRDEVLNYGYNFTTPGWRRADEAEPQLRWVVESTSPMASATTAARS